MAGDPHPEGPPTEAPPPRRGGVAGRLGVVLSGVALLWTVVVGVSGAALAALALGCLVVAAVRARHGPKAARTVILVGLALVATSVAVTLAWLPRMDSCRPLLLRDQGAFQACVEERTGLL